MAFHASCAERVGECPTCGSDLKAATERLVGGGERKTLPEAVSGTGKGAGPKMPVRRRASEVKEVETPGPKKKRTICPLCGTPVPAGSRFCQGCGGKVDQADDGEE